MSLPTNFFIGKGGGSSPLYEWAANTSILIKSTITTSSSYPADGYLGRGMTLTQMRNGIISSNSQASTWVNNNDFFKFQSGYQGIGRWTVPFDGLWKIEAGGAGGGSNTSNGIGGRGVVIGGYFNLIQGEIICLLPGQRGSDMQQDGSDSFNGGGGGSFVWRESEVPLGSAPAVTDYPLLAAGGGGGASDSTNPNGVNATTSQNGTSNSVGTAQGGSGGNGGSIIPGSYPATAGAGWRGNGAHGHTACAVNSYASTRPTYGGAGGRGGGEGPERKIMGGFGGGGGGGQRCGSAGGGGGGGYSGGAGGDYSGSSSSHNADSAGGGGGSYNSGTNTYTSGFVNHNTNGYIRIWSPV